MRVVPSERLADVLTILHETHRDHRGSFRELFNVRRYVGAGVPTRFVQDNLATSDYGVLRGLHYQVDRPQGKLVAVVAGMVYDVVVDVRRESPTFGRYAGFVLEADDGPQLWVPPGFAHGYLAMSRRAVMYYKVTDYYDPAGERVLRWDDPTVGVVWPALEGGRPPLLSPRDAAGAPLADVVATVLPEK